MKVEKFFNQGKTMLNESQVKYLASLHGHEIYIENTLTGLVPRPTNRGIVVPYNEFKKNMGLDDIRFNWLITDKNYIAGGSVLSWITQRPNDGDTDFYFKSSKTYEKDTQNFKNCLEEMFKFVETGNSIYAYSYFNSESNSKVQVVSGSMGPNAKSLCGRPIDIIKEFDISLCKFAIDNESLYTFSSSIRDLLSKSIRIDNVWNEDLSSPRVMKYSRRGYYTNGNIIKLSGEDYYGDHEMCGGKKR